jgi:IS30 family transposase
MLVKSQQGHRGVVTALIKSAQKREYTNLTWDRGKELADHPRFTLATNVDVYFCDPTGPPWQQWTRAEHQPAIEAVFAKRDGLHPFSRAKLSNRRATQRTSCETISNRRGSPSVLRRPVEIAAFV